MVGGFGECEVLSFHATKILNTLEGGAVLTNSDDLADKLRLMRNFGFRGFDDVGYLGTNGKMNEMAAAMGLTLLEDLARILAANQRNDECYRAMLGSAAGLQFLPLDAGERRNHHYVVVMLRPEAPLTRDELMEVLHAENVLARRYFYPGCHHMEPYASAAKRLTDLLPVTDLVASQVLLLPTGTAVSTNDIASICEIITTALDKADVVRPHLATAAEQ
jgi:dTDP-4-amino-4,6-dideoxygalactose transaminase